MIFPRSKSRTRTHKLALTFTILKLQFLIFLVPDDYITTNHHLRQDCCALDRTQHTCTKVKIRRPSCCRVVGRKKGQERRIFPKAVVAILAIDVVRFLRLFLLFQVHCVCSGGRKTTIQTTNLYLVLGFSTKMFQIQNSNQNNLQDGGKLVVYLTLIF